jgi:hypothetical protein
VPRDLAALLVEEGAASADAVDRARARQAELGGALDTALLELGVVSEDVLVPLLAVAAELPPAPAAAWAAEDPRARRVFPSRVAERHGLAPFALDGRELSLVATSPVDVALLDEISFMLSLHLTAHVGPEWRVRELIHRLYGSALAPRLAALAASGGAPPAGAAEGAEQPGAESAEPGWEEERRSAGPAEPDGAASPPGAPEEDLGGISDEPPRAPPALAGFGREDGEPLEPLAAALAQAVEAFDFSDFWGDPAAEPGTEPGAEPDAATAAVPPLAAEAAAAPAEPAPVEHAVEPATEQPAEQEDDEDLPPPDRSAPPRWSYEAAREALAAARSRDEVVLAALRYARDFFEFAALFAVTRDAVAGHDALGPEEGARDLCRGVAIYADDPGLFRTVIETRSPFLGPVTREAPGTDTILGGLARGSPRTALVYPVVLRNRPVCIVYADNGEAPASPRRLGDLLLVLSGVGAAFERVIQKQKRRPRARPALLSPPPAPAPGERWATHEPLRAAEPSSLPPSAGAPEPWTLAEPARTSAREPSPEPDPGPISDLVPEDRTDAPAPVLAREDAVDLAVDVDLGEGLALGAVPEAGFGAGFEAARSAPEPEREPGPPAREVEPERERHPPPSHAALADLALSPDASIADAARFALSVRRDEPDARHATERLRRALLSGISSRTAGAARALAALRDVEAVPLLVQALETSDGPAAQAAADALGAITLQRLGTDARRWLAWWKQNRGRGRADWLFSGLTSPDRETRVAAAEELGAAAPPPVAYSADLPAADREEAARAWATWWARSGQVL